MLNNFEKFSFPSIEKRGTKDKETDGKKEKKKNRKNEKMIWYITLHCIYILIDICTVHFTVSRIYLIWGKYQDIFRKIRIYLEQLKYQKEGKCQENQGYI